jgi:hypothetical protein
MCGSNAHLSLVKLNLCCLDGTRLSLYCDKDVNSRAPMHKNDIEWQEGYVRD